MPLISCPDCGRQVSDSAPTCPHCGRPAQPAMAATPPPLPPPLPKTLDRRPTLLSKIPKTVWPILIAGLVGFVVCSLVGQDHIVDDPVENLLINGFYGGIGGAALAAWIAALIICGMKGKAVFVAIGVILLFAPGLSLLPVIGAIRIARPNSTWARKYYGPKKMQIACARFPKDASRSSRAG
jgi:hypothetical protein